MPIGRLVIAGENRLLREGLKQILECPSISVVGEVRSLVGATDFLKSIEPAANLLICDPGSDAAREFAAIKELSHEFPNLGTVVLTSSINHTWLDRAIDCGARGFLPNEISSVALHTLLELVLLGENIFAGPRNMPEREIVADTFSPKLMGQQLRVPLSPKESEILTCLGDGLPNKVIARNLNIAEATVKVHLKALLRKINVENRTQAAIWGLNQKAGNVGGAQDCRGM
jgi:two-component system nitrate/nitrite response regulator NarL